MKVSDLLHVRLKGLNNDMTEKEAQPFVGIVTYVHSPVLVNAFVIDSIGRPIVCHDLEIVPLGTTPGTGSWAVPASGEEAPRIQLLN